MDIQKIYEDLRAFQLKLMEDGSEIEFLGDLMMFEGADKRLKEFAYAEGLQPSSLRKMLIEYHKSRVSAASDESGSPERDHNGDGETSENEKGDFPVGGNSGSPASKNEEAVSLATREEEVSSNTVAESMDAEEEEAETISSQNMDTEYDDDGEEVSIFSIQSAPTSEAGDEDVPPKSRKDEEIEFAENTADEVEAEVAGTLGHEASGENGDSPQKNDIETKNENKAGGVVKSANEYNDEEMLEEESFSEYGMEDDFDNIDDDLGDKYIEDWVDDEKESDGKRKKSKGVRKKKNLFIMLIAGFVFLMVIVGVGIGLTTPPPNPGKAKGEKGQVSPGKRLSMNTSAHESAFRASVPDGAAPKNARMGVGQAAYLPATTPPPPSYVAPAQARPYGAGSTLGQPPSYAAPVAPAMASTMAATGAGSSRPVSDTHVGQRVGSATGNNKGRGMTGSHPSREKLRPSAGSLNTELTEESLIYSMTPRRNEDNGGLCTLSNELLDIPKGAVLVYYVKKNKKYIPANKLKGWDGRGIRVGKRMVAISIDDKNGMVEVEEGQWLPAEIFKSCKLFDDK